MPSPKRGRGAAAKPAAGKIVRKAVEKLEKPIVRVTGPNRSLPTRLTRGKPPTRLMRRSRTRRVT